MPDPIDLAALEAAAEAATPDFGKPPGYYRAGEGGCTCWPPSAPDFQPTEAGIRICGPRGVHSEGCAVTLAWDAHSPDVPWFMRPFVWVSEKIESAFDLARPVAPDEGSEER